MNFLKYLEELNNVVNLRQRRLWQDALSDEIRDVYGESSKILSVINNSRIIADGHHLKEQDINDSLKEKLETLVDCIESRTVSQNKSEEAKNLVARYLKSLNRVENHNQRQIWWAALSDEVRDVYGKSSKILSVINNSKIRADGHYLKEQDINDALKRKLEELQALADNVD